MTSASAKVTTDATAGAVLLNWNPGRTVATITLDRPRKLNALSLGMLAALENHVTSVRDSAAQAVVVRSTGEKAFCVGADVTQFAQFRPDEMWRRWIAEGHRVFNALAQLRQPTIAVVDGLAVGGGLELALACDLRVGSSTARLGLPETGLGTIPGWGGTERLTAAVGTARAKELIFTRRYIDAATAHAWGLLNTVADGADLDTVTQEFIDQILGGAPIAVQVGKQLVHAAAAGAPSATLEALASGFTTATSDFAAGVRAFQNKTEPTFTSG
jgi:enoyl-CoA hydratase/carnithine racemase